MNPSVSWEGSSSSGDLDLSYGVDASAVPTTDLASLPRRVWGAANTNVGGWGVSARAEKDVAGGSDTSVEIDLNNDDADLSINAVASAGGGLNFHRVEGTKSFDSNGSRLSINPRHNLDSGDSDVIVSYDNGGTNVVITASADNQEISARHDMGDTQVGLTASADNQEVTIDHSMGDTQIGLVASADNQEVTINHQAGDTRLGLVASADNQEVTVDHTAGDTNIKLTASADNQDVTITQRMGQDTISPSFNNRGDISVAWERDLGDDNSLTATLKPNESLDVEWNDGDWTASVNCGLDGINVDGANVNIKRDINF